MIPPGDRPEHDYSWHSDPESKELERLTGPPDVETFSLPSRREMAQHEARNIGNLPIRAKDIRIRVWEADKSTVTFTLDEATAALMMFAARALMMNYQAHAREVRLYGRTLNGWGKRNREAIADRLERHVARLAMVDREYRRETEGDRLWGM
jgi:hypothetical protein